jgi:glycosyltransferase involved in cell wall biosynthesis
MLLGAVEKMVRFIYGNCDRILIQSRAFVDSIRGKGVPESKISYFPNSAETLYQPMAPNDDAADQLKMPAGFRIMYAGNIGAAQGFDSILDCAEMLRHYTDIHWVIFGDGCKSDWVMQEVERRRLTECVHIMGRHSIESMPKYFAVADAMLVSLRKDEIFALTIPAKVQSYLACGKPIIAALDGEGARIVTESGAGVASAAGHPGNLSDAVLTLYRLSESERAEMGARGRTYYETHFERETQLSRFEGMINELVAEGKGKDSLCVKKC